MALPVVANTTCDIYRTGNAPPNPPDVAGVACNLKPDFRGGKQASILGVVHSWTHLMLIDSTVDLRDSYTQAGGDNPQDDVWIPDQNGTQFKVIFAELVGRGTSNEHLRVYLDRRVPPWPTPAP